MYHAEHNKPLTLCTNLLKFITIFVYHYKIVKLCVLYFVIYQKPLIKVWHRGLLKKLKAYGISGNLLHWFENYLSDRNQKVVLQNCFSEVGNVKGGVPQGSVLTLCYSYYISMILLKIFKVFHDCLLMIHHYRIHLLI